jgi:16S rRNA (uracil1498-N3)-methyltransferase
MPHFFMNRHDLVDGTALIRGPDAKHIRTVLRNRPGDEIGLFDGAGLEYEGVIESVSSEGIRVRITRSFEAESESGVRITVAQALLKNKKMDTLIRQLTELGIYGWIPFASERSVARLEKEKRADRKARWEKISREALKQCRRGRLPKIEPKDSLNDILDMAVSYDVRILFWEEETATLDSPDLFAKHNTIEDIFMVTGPEGGFSREEVAAAREKGFVMASLGPRILKADTASIAACTLVQFLFGDMGHR